MALHIQMSEEAEAELRKTALRNKISSTLACLFFVLLGGGILYFAATYIAGNDNPTFIVYQPMAEDGPPTNNPVTDQLSARSSPASAQVAPSVIVAQNATNAAMAPVVMNMADGLSMEASFDVGLGEGLDLGSGLGDDGNGLGSGKSGGSALEGTFYDLKLTRNGAATPLANPKGGIHEPLFIEAVSEFLKNWSEAALNKYYKSPRKLYASNFYLPAAMAEYAPIAYECKEKCKPSGWIAIYRGRVKAPKTGTFRFVGTGDDFLAVRFNRKTVLEAGYRIPSMWDKANPRAYHVSSAGNGKAYRAEIKAGKDKKHPGYDFIQVPGMTIWNNEVGGLTAGIEFDVKEGKTYPIEIAISEIPGGLFGFVVFIQEKTGDKFPTDPKTLDIFRTNFSLPNKAEITKLLREAKCLRGDPQCPPYNEDSLIWTAAP